MGQFDSKERSVIDFPRENNQPAPEALQNEASGGELWRHDWIRHEISSKPRKER